jgi:hypothetical protein
VLSELQRRRGVAGSVSRKDSLNNRALRSLSQGEADHSSYLDFGRIGAKIGLAALDDERQPPIARQDSP